LVFWYLNITYDNAFWVLFVLTIGLAGYVLYNIYGLNYFIVHRQDKLVMKNTIITSIIGFVIAFPLVYFFGIIGTAINLSFSRWMMGGGLYFKYKKSIHNDNSHT
jgi:PST family polysaccharide transporter